MSPSLRRRVATDATDATPAPAAPLAAAPIREPQDTREEVARLANRLDLFEEGLLRFADAGAALGDCYVYGRILLYMCPHAVICVSSYSRRMVCCVSLLVYAAFSY
jgi:hypothetical protein